MAEDETSAGQESSPTLDVGPPTDRPRAGRLRAWLTHRPTGWSALVPVIALGAGLLFATSSATARGTDLRAESADLPGLIQEGTRENERAAQRVEVLREDIERLTSEAAPGSKRLREVEQRTTAVADEAGLVPATGEAVTVTLDDAHLDADEIPPGFTVNDVIVHQQDVQGVVNALWRGGAEAMQIMDQRVISTSAVRCVGNTLILQGRVYSPPFRITAVGDPDELQEALDEDPAVAVYRQYVAAVGLGYEVTVDEQRELPAFSGQTGLEYARAVPDER
ncbi:DUF881 domain-containing protein [Janibacter cremeus]|uniref:DUF881 domain-containing protein n=1 Tax=Janibacter cremeus TaxID=1285192 RepID=UPI0023F7B815|nr:DUF881 domain-containing protein [Janibacter cremeus]WEV77441.1 DUF881 domain-containing protein [Janibacter cremeus]